ncbi:MAG: cell division protein ZapE [Legionellales bacterium]|nr:cell division protein ZapE [Legionellales bacterium]
MTPIERYENDLREGHVVPDSTQAASIKKLQEIYEGLVSKQNQLFSRLQNCLKKKREPVKGIYLWGGVGIGKTYMMDVFYESLPFKEKKRMHFHYFMQMVHEQLTLLQGHTDPLPLIAKKLAEECRVLCFDEFFVKDIADAMLLAGILAAIFRYGITLVTTSNVQPDDLYYNGLQRSNFLPAIALIKKYTLVWHVDSLQDYRLKHLSEFGGYIFPLNEHAEHKLKTIYRHLAHGTLNEEGSLTVNARVIPYRGMHADAIWFEFDIVCNIPRSQLDYIEIARHFHSVIVSNVPVLAHDDFNRLRYLMNLVDVFYDSRVKLVLSAAVALHEIYPSEGGMAKEFQRTLSRLQEMQSHDYWHQSNISRQGT